MILEGVCGIIGLLESRKGKFMFHREGSSVVPFEAISNYIEQGFGDCVVSEEILTNKASLLRVNPLDVIGEDGVITERAKAILDEVKSLEQLRYYKNRRNSVKILRGNTTDFERRSLLSGANRDISKGNKLNIEAVFNWIEFANFAIEAQEINNLFVENLERCKALLGNITPRGVDVV